MPARNIHHNAVIQALQADGWTITHDPLLIPYGDRRLFIDLGAERALIGAERESERIAVEIASFVADSPVRDLQEAVGQFVVYRALLAQSEPERLLFLGVPTRVYDSVLSEPLGQLIVADVRLRIVVFDAQQQQVVQWIS
ncbi:MAG TPA: element excision factor XisH family protein [Gemmataceae bacterium]|nr:element excision factor XisH family protein [Gemmataceae bacterium]